MTQTGSGVTIPGPDPEAVTAAPIQDIWNDLGLSLNGKLLVPSTSTADRAARVAALAADGTPVSASAPLLTARADAPNGAKVEFSTDGSAFFPLAMGSTGSLITPATNWAALTGQEAPRIFRFGHVFALMPGRLARVTSGLSTSAGTPFTIGQLPAGTFPAVNTSGIAIVHYNMSASPVFGKLVVDSSGTITVTVATAGTFGTTNDQLNGVHTPGIWWVPAS